MKRHKRLVAVFVIIAATIIIELFFNYHALVEGYEPLDISDHIVFTELEDEPGYLISYESKLGIYVKQIKLVGDYSVECEYEVDVTAINEFGKAKAVINENAASDPDLPSYTDTTSAWFSDYYTNINAKVKSLEVRVPQKGNGQIKAAYLLNSFEVNKYRVLFVLVALILLYCTLFEHFFVKRTEWFFAVFTTIFGMLIILYGQPTGIGWDEQIHFSNVYSAAYGKNVEWTAAARAITKLTTPKCDTKAEYAQLRQAMDKAGQQVLYTERKDNAIIPYSYVSYIPLILFLKLGMLMQLPFTWLYMLGKVGNLFSYVVLVFLAIRMARRQKLLLAFVSMMPTTVFLASTYSYDAFVIASIELGCVLWCNEMMNPKVTMSKSHIIAMTFLFTVGCFSKAVYIPLTLLVLIIPGILKNTKKQTRILWIGILLVFVLAMLTFVLPFLTNVVTRNVAYGGDLRGGDTSAVRQFISIVKHPIASIRLIISSVLQWNSFRLVDSTLSGSNYYVGYAMLTRFFALGNLPEIWNIVLLPVLTILFFHQDNVSDGEKCFGGWQQIYGIAVLLVTVVFIWLSMYLSFTEVGENRIVGVQPRYFIPLIYLGAILFQNNKIAVKASSKCISRIAMLTVSFVWLFGCYDIMLRSRLF